MRTHEAVITTGTIPPDLAKAVTTAMEDRKFSIDRSGKSANKFTFGSEHQNEVRIAAVYLIQDFKLLGLKVTHYRLNEIVADSDVFDYLGLM